MFSVSKYNNVILLNNSNNNGISKALNDCIKLASQKGYEWILTLDQDSVCPKNLISEYLKYIKLENVALLTPKIHVHSGRNIEEGETINDYEFIDRCITSASLVNIAICENIGYFDEKMVIDYVDHDYCKRLNLLGYKIVLCNKITLYHELGSNIPIKWSIFFNKYLGTKIIYQSYSPFRAYYIIRNCIYFIRKYSTSLTKTELKKALTVSLYHVALKSLLFGDQKWSYFKSICKGIFIGSTIKTTKWKNFLKKDKSIRK
jgi:rhamnosyltransferase